MVRHGVSSDASSSSFRRWTHCTKGDLRAGHSETSGGVVDLGLAEPGPGEKSRRLDRRLLLHFRNNRRSANMSTKRKRDSDDPPRDERRGNKRPQGGFKVGPDNLPDGTYRRKSMPHPLSSVDIPLTLLSAKD